MAALMSGQVQVIGAPPPRDYARMKDGATAGIKGNGVPSLGSLMLMVHNTRKAPFDDLDFRMAVSLATDRKTIAEKVFYGLVEPSALPVPASSPFYDAKAAAGLAFDLAKAKEHLAKSKYASAAEFELLYSTQPYILDVKDAALFLQATLGQIGIKVKLQPVETGQLLGQVAQGNQVSALAAVIGPSDPTFMIQSIYTPGQVFTKGSGYNSDRLNTLFADSNKAADDAALRTVMAQMQSILAADAPSTWIGALQSFNLWRADVKGFEPNTGITLRLGDVTIA